MPALPEAENIVRGLRRTLRDRRIREVRVDHADILPQAPSEFRSSVRNRRIVDVTRRGKNVVVRLEDRACLVVNLGMTGKLLPDPPSSGPGAPTHPALRFEMEDGGELIYDDVRRFGRVEVLDPEGLDEWSEALGPEPLAEGFTAETLARRVGHSRSPIRSWLLDQRRIAGVGNIYANEALFRARIHPRRPARSLRSDESEALHEALRTVLRDAIRAGGTTIRDYRDADGRAGTFAARLRVYDRAGEPCPRCGTPIRRTVFGNRSAFHCPRCQPDPAEGDPSA